MSPQDLIALSYQDLIQDFAEIQYLGHSAQETLDTTVREIHRVGRYLFANTHHTVFQTIRHIQQIYDHIRTEAEKANYSAQKERRDHQSLLALTERKDQLYDLLRTYQGIYGATIAATDWQSPSFLHTMHTQAGRQTGRIEGTINDYKRDQHLDARVYEERFRKEYIDGWVKFPINVYATSSGMAAFTTILNFLLLEGKTSGTILGGSSLYFECKDLAQRTFGNRYISVDEGDTPSILTAIDRYRPSVLFLDSLCNAARIPVPNLPVIISHLKKSVTTETYLILDNTCMPLFFQPIPAILGKNRRLRCIVFESLNKYHQFGFDRITGGIIYAVGKDTSKLFSYREHLGTNIPDVSVLSLPRPNRNALTQRLLRHTRNAAFLASHLREHLIHHPNRKVASIEFPDTRPGSFLTITFTPQHQKPSVYQTLVKKVLNEAKKEGIDMVSGTSFGFNRTRIYLTALRAEIAEPFVRISVGTEHMSDMHRLAHVCIRALRTM